MKITRFLVLLAGSLIGAALAAALWRRSRPFALQKCDLATYLVAPGADIRDAAEEACELANEGGFTVLFIFNGVPVKVVPGMNTRAAVNCYRIGLAHVEEQARAARAEAEKMPAPAPVATS